MRITLTIPPEMLAALEQMTGMQITSERDLVEYLLGVNGSALVAHGRHTAARALFQANGVEGDPVAMFDSTRQRLKLPSYH